MGGVTLSREDHSDRKNRTVPIDQLLERTARVLREQFDLTALLPHAGTKGTQREKLIIDFLNNHLPRRFSASTGFIVDFQGNTGAQTDVVLYDASLSPTYYYADDVRVVDRNCALAAIEVKSCLTGRDIEKAIEDARRVKMLSTTPNTVSVYSLSGPEQNRRVTGTHVPLHYSIFAYESEMTLNGIAKKWSSLYAESPFGFQVDRIVVLDKGIVELVGTSGPTALQDDRLYSIHSPPFFAASEEEIQSTALSLSLTADGALEGRPTPSPCQPGSRFYLAATELGQRTLDCWFRSLLQVLSLYCDMAHPQIPFLRWEQQAVDSTTRLLPVVVCADLLPKDSTPEAVQDEFRLRLSQLFQVLQRNNGEPVGEVGKASERPTEA